MMFTPIIGFLGGQELVLVLVLMVFLFGAKKLPELAGSIGKSVKSFKESVKDDPADTSSASSESSADVQSEKV